MTIRFSEFKARLLANAAVKAEYDALALESEIAIELVKARLRAGCPGPNSPQKWEPANR
jgi:hypothetical protein